MSSKKESPISVGTTVDHYKILEALDGGGMGIVYRGEDTRLGREVALKFLPDSLSRDDLAVQRFELEARAASSLNHPNICTIHDIGTFQGQPFIVMELMQGQTLRECIQSGPLESEFLLSVAAQIATALDAAHEKGIIHRDIKPANVFVTDSGQVKLLDFGLAKLTPLRREEEVDSDGLTTAGVSLGTPHFMSPEQLEDRPLDPRSDLFGLGVLLYRVSTGSLPFKGKDLAAIFNQILSKSPTPPTQLNPEIPAAFGEVIQKALRKDRKRRYQSAAEMLRDIRAIQRDLDATRPIVLEHSPASRLPIWPIVAGVAGLAGLALLILGLLGPSADPQPDASLPQMNIRNFTTDQGEERQPRFSPDGRGIAFIWNGPSADNYDVYVKLVGTQTPLRLTQHPASDFGPVWSPDGREIAFFRRLEEETSILLVSSLGGPERRIGSLSPLAEFETAAWSPDRRTLAVTDRVSPDSPNRIFLLSLESGEKVPFSQPPPLQNDRDAAFSPDGSTVAFVRVASIDSANVFVQSVEGGPARQLTSEAKPVSSLAFSHRGESIVFSTGSFEDANLWRIPIDGGTSQPLLFGQRSRQPTISSDGLAYSQFLRIDNIWEIPTDREAAVPTPLIRSTQRDTNPQFSPQGDRIAFGSNRTGNFEVWVTDSDGSNPVQLTTLGDADAGSPRWSPDGSRLAFDSLASGSFDIYTVSSEGGAQQAVTTGSSSDVRPSWSRDGEWIYFGSNRKGQWQIWKIPSGGGDAQQVTYSGGWEAFESRDSRFLYFSRFREEPGIWRVSPQGGEEIQVCRGGGQGVWTLAEEGIYYIDVATEELLLCDLEGDAHHVADLKAPHSLGLSVSPDGSRLVFSQFDLLNSDIMLVENFR